MRSFTRNLERTLARVMFLGNGAMPTCTNLCSVSPSNSMAACVVHNRMVFAVGTMQTLRVLNRPT